VSLRELAALARRHGLAVGIVLLIAMGTAYGFKHTPPAYQEGGSLVLTPVQALTNPNPYTSPFAESMISTGEVMVKWLTGPQGQQQLDRAGADDNFGATLINFSDQEYPFYGQPYLTVTGTGNSAAAAHSALIEGIQVFNNELTDLQSQVGVPSDTRITTHMVGDSGPMVQPGSNKRVYAGLGFLTIVAAFMLASFLDRHPFRFGLAYWQRRSRQGRLLDTR
jgi:hypothetical protein